MLEPLFTEHFHKCPIDFQEQFRKAYQLLKVADYPLDVKSVINSINNPKRFKLVVDKSRISLHFNEGKLKVVCFLYNQFHNAE